MKRRLFVGGVAVAAVLGGAIYLRAPGAVPQGQQPLVTLSPAQASGFETAFDAGAGTPQLVLLLSPT